MKRDDLVKIRKYSIRKVKMGAVSALIGTLFLGSVTVLPAPILAQEESDATVAINEPVESLSTLLGDAAVSPAPTLTPEENDTATASNEPVETTADQTTETVENNDTPELLPTIQTTETAENNSDTLELSPTTQEVPAEIEPTQETEAIEDTTTQATAATAQNTTPQAKKIVQPTIEGDLIETVGNEEKTITISIPEDQRQSVDTVSLFYQRGDSFYNQKGGFQPLTNGKVVIKADKLIAGESLVAVAYDTAKNEVGRSSAYPIGKLNSLNYQPQIETTEVYDTVDNESTQIQIRIPAEKVSAETHISLYVYDNTDRLIQIPALVEVNKEGIGVATVTKLAAGNKIVAVAYSKVGGVYLKSQTSAPLIVKSRASDYKLSVITKEVEETIGNEVATIKFKVATESLHDQLTAKIVYADSTSTVKVNNITRDYFNRDGEVILSLASLKPGERFLVELHDGKTNKIIRSAEAITVLPKSEVNYTPNISPKEIVETAPGEKVPLVISIPQWHVDKADYLVVYVQSNGKIVQYQTLDIAHDGTAKTELTSLSAGDQIIAIAYNRNSSGKLIKSKTSEPVVVKSKSGKPDTKNETPDQPNKPNEPKNDMPNKPNEPKNDMPNKPNEPKNDMPNKPNEPKNDMPNDSQNEDLTAIKLQAKNAIKEAVIAEKEEISKASISKNLKKLYSRLAEQEATKFIEMIDQAKNKMEVEELVSTGKARIAAVFEIKKELAPNTDDKSKNNPDTKDKKGNETPDKEKKPQPDGSNKTDTKPSTPPKDNMAKVEKNTSNSTTTSTTSQKTLPKTGTKDNLSIQLVGALIGWLAIGLGILSNRRKKQSK